jgi:hypothetical protein
MMFYLGYIASIAPGSTAKLSQFRRRKEGHEFEVLQQSSAHKDYHFDKYDIEINHSNANAPMEV